MSVTYLHRHGYPSAWGHDRPRFSLGDRKTPPSGVKDEVFSLGNLTLPREITELPTEECLEVLESWALQSVKPVTDIYQSRKIRTGQCL